MTGGATIDVLPAHRFDEARLAAYLAGRVPGFAGAMRVRQFAGGQSNPTYLLETPDASYVLRRKPPGVTLPSAHAVDREFRVQSALGAAGLPVPRMLQFCADEEVIGSPFYVMEHVRGRVLWDPAMADLPPKERWAQHEAMVRTLAGLHALDPSVLGLSDYGKPSDYFGRQIARWTRQYRADPEAGRVPDMDQLAEWLPAQMPEGEGASVVHGDFRLDNVMFAEHSARVVAVIDWELSTLGPPLADLSYLLLMYKFPQTLMKSLAGLDPAALGVPTEDETVALYAEASGRPLPGNRDVLHAYNLFRFAAICHGIRGRMIKGNASSAQAERYARHVEPLATFAVEHARRAGM